MNDKKQKILDLKKEMDAKLLVLRLKRKDIILKFKKKLEEVKINQIRNKISK